MLAFLPATSPFLARHVVRRSTWKCCTSSFLKRPIHAKAAQDLIEVESRFHVTPQAKRAFNVLAGDCKQIRFKDRYYCEQLALLDKWLRQRDHQWELKIPVNVRASTSHRGAVAYKELLGNAALQHVNALGFSTKEMKVYACITTVRSMWKFDSRMPWGDYDMQITADECFADDGFKYNIGEIEVLVTDDEHVDGATKALERTCQQLKLEKIGSSGGKLMRYLYEKKPELYQTLQANGVV